MKKMRKFSYLAAAVVVFISLAFVVFYFTNGGPKPNAPLLNVIAIGDSLTEGTSGDTWVVSLKNKINNDPQTSFAFRFVGTQKSRKGGVTVRHEGYGGWYIETSNFSGTSGRSGIRDNLTSRGGVIAPQNADIVILLIGINDVLGLSDGGSTVADTGEIVNDLGTLIDEIVDLAPEATVFVSTLLPLSDGGLFGLTDGTYGDANQHVDAVNGQLLLDFFGGRWLGDDTENDAYALHHVHENVFLLNTHLAIDGGPSSKDISPDGVHLTEQGNRNLGNWYADRLAFLLADTAEERDALGPAASPLR
ncbi:MAG: SGNH/GDSL hydrolase family protein [Planctomycetota bacterium]